MHKVSSKLMETIDTQIVDWFSEYGYRRYTLSSGEVDIRWSPDGMIERSTVAGTFRMAVAMAMAEHSIIKEKYREVDYERASR